MAVKRRRKLAVDTTTAVVPPRKRVHHKQSSSTSVTKQDSEGNVETLVNEEEHGVSESLVNPAHVSVSGGMTKSLEDYESAKVSVMITRPCENTLEAIDRTYEECSQWVEDKLVAEIERI